MTDDPNMSAKDFAATADDATLRYFRKQLADILSLSRMSTCSAEINEIAGALAKAQDGFETPKRNCSVSFSGRNYKYADLEAVYKAVRKALAGNGLAITHLCQEFAGQVELVTMLTHSSGQWFRSVYPVKAKVDLPQEFGSAMTYARRYSVSALLGIASEEDDDAQSAQEASKAAGRDPALREGLDRLNARQEAPQEPVGADLALMSPETGEIEKTWPRKLGGVREFMRQLETACQHSGVYWAMNGAQARDLAAHKPDLKVDDETLSKMVERLEGMYGGQVAEDPEDIAKHDPKRLLVP